MPTPEDFVYFSSLRELADWQPETASSHPWNISNTPLTPRPSVPPPPSANTIPHLLICHDFRGSYIPSERAQGLFPNPTSTAPLYTAEYLSLVDTFVYFSHKRVSIPPAPWINHAHRHGVKILGTFLLEHAEDGDEASRLFTRGSEGEFLYAAQLARIAETYGFDGWLLNIETAFPRSQWKPGTMQAWIKELSGRDMCSVVWYDAVTVLNRVHYQNGLTLLNAPWFHVADMGMLTNYFWRGKEMKQTEVIAKYLKREKEIWTGVDCYGRGSLGGGGFGVGEALTEIRKAGTSAGLFAPGWTFENFDGRDFQDVEKRFWGIVGEYVTPKEYGTRELFYTNFNRGFGSEFWLQGESIYNKPWVHLGLQSLLPTYPSSPTAPLHWTYDDTLSFTGGWSLHITSTSAHSTSTTTNTCPLYKLSITYDPDLIVSYKLTALDGSNGGLYWDFVPSSSPSDSPQNRKRVFHPVSVQDGEEMWTSGTAPLTGDNTTSNLSGFRLVEIGAYWRDGSDGGFHLGELMITTSDISGSAEVGSEISKVVVGGEGRLSWNVYTTFRSVLARKRKVGMWSDVTKDFAWFVVWKGKRMVGVSFAGEFWVESKESEQDEGAWSVSGVTWDGRVLHQEGVK